MSEIPLTDEDRRIWDRMSYFACYNYMQGHSMDTGISRYMTVQNWIVTPMQPAQSARIRIDSAERLGVFNDRFAIY